MRAELLRDATKCLRDPFTRNTKDRQKQLLLASIICILASLSQITIAKATHTFVVFQFGGDVAAWTIKAAAGALTVYLLLTFYLSARQESKIDEYRTEVFAMSATLNLNRLMDGAETLQHLISERLAEKSRLAASIQEQFDEELERQKQEKNTCEAAKAAIEAERAPLDQQVIELEAREPPPEQRTEYLEWLTECNYLRNKQSEFHERVLELYVNSPTRDEADMWKFDIASQIDLGEDPAMASYSRHAEAVVKLAETLKYISTNRKWRVGLEVFGPSIFALAFLAALAMSQVPPRVFHWKW